MLYRKFVVFAVPAVAAEKHRSLPNAMTAEEMEESLAALFAAVRTSLLLSSAMALTQAAEPAKVLLL